MGKGNFIISLDFELHWGGAEKWDLSERKAYFDNTRKSIPLVLALFEKYNIHATWATVGFLFAESKEDIIKYSPDLKPSYLDHKLSYYPYIESKDVGSNEKEDPYHFAHSLIKKIISTPNQELASHSFEHYYCNEPGQTMLQFDADLKAAQAISRDKFNIELKSLVLPRNQFNLEYIEIAKNNGIKVVRSNPDVWFWQGKDLEYPIARAIDALTKISKSSIFSKSLVKNGEILLLPASRFLRPYTKNEKKVHFLKFSRIKREMTKAAKQNKNYHLWWHPHNFGNSLDENLKYLEDILKHYKKLNHKHDFNSKTMIEMYENE
ncbi:polysaccharide deacetylase family protein [Brumimicrobium mesophilum]|uniref:polysaccharide deacetylase family protein n=1 Tax=Brumimicrobium mesophilum TaxID=392717 RepID=UPI000D140C76|nr:polysaccharide deacetylase family protein [Brumimicrobium mesophilum]